MTCSVVARLIILLFALSKPQVQEVSDREEQEYDFGHVGIEFQIFHTYKYVNRTNHDVRILEADANCDCTTLNFTDSVLSPGDTALIHLSFNTRDYFGLTNKAFYVRTDDPDRSEIKYYYITTIGQWRHGLKPNPISLFFLPGKKSQKITIPNVKFDRIMVENPIPYDSTFTFKVTKGSAAKGELLEIQVAANENLTPRTYYSSLTMEITASEQPKPTILTIPVKIVRF